MFILDSLLIGSLRFVLDKVVAAAEAEMHDDTALREQLLEAQMRLELGEITDDEFAEIERDVLARIREIKGAPAGRRSRCRPRTRSPASTVESFEVLSRPRSSPSVRFLRRQGRRRQDDVRGGAGRRRERAAGAPRPGRVDRSRALARRRARRRASRRSRAERPRRRPRAARVELDAPRAFARWLHEHRRALGDILEHGTWLDRDDVDALLDLVDSRASTSSSACSRSSACVARRGLRTTSSSSTRRRPGTRCGCWRRRRRSRRSPTCSTLLQRGASHDPRAARARRPAGGGRSLIALLAEQARETAARLRDPTADDVPLGDAARGAVAGRDRGRASPRSSAPASASPRSSSTACCRTRRRARSAIGGASDGAACRRRDPPAARARPPRAASSPRRSRSREASRRWRGSATRRWRRRCRVDRRRP